MSFRPIGQVFEYCPVLFSVPFSVNENIYPETGRSSFLDFSPFPLNRIITITSKLVHCFPSCILNLSPVISDVLLNVEQQNLQGKGKGLTQYLLESYDIITPTLAGFQLPTSLITKLGGNVQYHTILYSIYTV